ncbi:MAG: 2-octaprenyl-6-methoxyphenyl hydroxylase [Proteobacteria bacterium]|nr:MAG: 2-octaprenyl-6-methoxyphenyl hydroxylase [Pseudomonadota bacterium]
MKPATFDLVIAGGGLTGASLACAAASLGRRVAVLESFAIGDDQQPSFDERTIALTFASRRVLEGLGVWRDIDAEACPIESIHISDRGHFGTARLDRSHAGTAALGYVVPTRALGAALTRRMQRFENLEFYCPATAESVEQFTDRVEVRGTNDIHLSAPLLALADGGRSGLGARCGLELETRRYPKVALVAIVGLDRSHENRAFERFTKHGPLALLPMTGQRMALAWTLPEVRARQLASAPADEFLAALQRTFGDRCGAFTRVGSRQTYPLSLGRLAKPFRGRVLAVGNAAHVVHPVAGQGFNLGLRDVAELADHLATCWRVNLDIGGADGLRRYARERRAQTRNVSVFTDGLIGLFTSPAPIVTAARGIGLNVVDVLPPAKRFFLRRTMGLQGRLPRLARGLAPDGE